MLVENFMALLRILAARLALRTAVITMLGGSQHNVAAELSDRAVAREVATPRRRAEAHL